MIFQNFALLERKNVFDNVAFPLKCAKVDKNIINEKVDSLLKRVGIFEKKNDMPNQLSGGQRQRVAIARALALNPDILLCDEATSGLDPKTTDTILDLLVEINLKDEITIVLVTHELDVVEKICDKVAIIENGKIVCDGLVEEVLNEYYSINNIDDFNEAKTYLKISYVNNEANNSLLADLALQTNIKFEVNNSKTQIFKDKKMSVFIISFDSDMSIVLDLLKERNIKYEIVDKKGMRI